MRYKVLLFVLLVVPGFVWAQHCDSINNHMAGYYFLMPQQEVIQLGDGSLLNAVRQDSIASNGQEIFPYLYKLYKISRQETAIMDSTIIETKDFNSVLLARIHDNGKGFYNDFPNILVKTVPNRVTNETYMRIAFFDDNLVFNESMEVSVLLSDTLIARSAWRNWLLDSQNDIIFHYDVLSRKEAHFTRIGLDGTIKNETVYPDTIVPLFFHNNADDWMPNGLVQYSDNPIGYNFFGRWGTQSGEYFRGFELDSLLNIVYTVDLRSYYTNPGPDYSHIHNDGCYNGMLTLDNETVLIVRQIYVTNGGIHKRGIYKYDREGNVIKSVSFASPPGGGIYNVVTNGLLKDGNGNIYFSYWFYTQENINAIAVIKLDEDLNIIWERYGMHKKWDIFTRQPCGLEILDDGGVSVFGYNCRYKEFHHNQFPSGIFMMLLDDGGVGVSETGVTVRPYLLYPNPVGDILHLEFSPDVEPRIVELYDIQGRLLRTQNSGFKNIGMENLPAGTYTLRVTMEDGTAYSDKVVKQ